MPVPMHQERLWFSIIPTIVIGLVFLALVFSFGPVPEMLR